jgi:hypothetical protein
MQAAHRSRRNRAESLITKLAELVEDYWYTGRSGADITFNASAPASNPFVRGYTRPTRLDTVPRRYERTDTPWGEAPAA